MSTMNQPEVMVTITTAASTEVRKFIDQEGVDAAKGGLRVSVQPGGCSGFKYGLLIEDDAAEDDIVVDQGDWRVFVDTFRATAFTRPLEAERPFPSRDSPCRRTRCFR